MVILGTIWNLIWVSLLIWQVFSTTELKRWVRERDKKLTDQINMTNDIYSEIKEALRNFKK